MKYNLKLILMTFLSTLSVLLIAASLPAEPFYEVNMEKFLTEKRKIVKDAMQLTDSESAVFWLLYDEYEKIIVESINNHSVLIKEYMREHENLSDKKAKAMLIELLQLQAEQVRNKRVFKKKFSEKLAPIKVLQYFVLEEIIEAGYLSMIAQELPLIE